MHHVIIVFTLIARSGLAMRSRVYRPNPPTTATTTLSDPASVRLIISRHGLSCSNVIVDYGERIHKVAGAFYRDPPLSNCGVTRSKAAAKMMKDEKIDIVGSSELLRAIETATYQYGGRTVHVFPYISEWPGRLLGETLKVAKAKGGVVVPEMTPLSSKEQKQTLKKLQNSVKVDYSWAPPNATVPSWAKFENFLATQLLPAHNVTKDSGLFSIGIVSHSLFMKYALADKKRLSLRFSGRIRTHDICREAIPKGASKPFNNQAWEIHFRYYRREKRLIIDETKGCRSLGSTRRHLVGVPAMPPTICEHDFERCFAQWNPEHKPSTGTFAADPASFPATCATGYECYDGAPPFPKISSVEQRWADKWRKVDKMKSVCLEAASERPNHWQRIRGKLSDCRQQYPPFPDLSAQCSCQADVA